MMKRYTHIHRETVTQTYGPGRLAARSSRGQGGMAFFATNNRRHHFLKSARGTTKGELEASRRRSTAAWSAQRWPRQQGPLTADVQQGKTMRGRQIPGPPSAGAAGQDRGGDEMERKECGKSVSAAVVWGGANLVIEPMGQQKKNAHESGANKTGSRNCWVKLRCSPARERILACAAVEPAAPSSPHACRRQ